MADSTAIYCTLTPTEERDRRSQVRANIVPQVVAVTELADGLRLDFRVYEGFRELVEEFIVLERDCCSFLTFTLSLPGNELSLLIQGPPNAAHVIEMFRRALKGEDR